jgi:hypothetical protein
MTQTFDVLKVTNNSTFPNYYAGLLCNPTRPILSLTSDGVNSNPKCICFCIGDERQGPTNYQLEYTGIKGSVIHFEYPFSIDCQVRQSLSLLNTIQVAYSQVLNPLLIVVGYIENDLSPNNTLHKGACFESGQNNQYWVILSSNLMCRNGRSRHLCCAKFEISSSYTIEILEFCAVSKQYILALQPTQDIDEDTLEEIQMSIIEEILP